MMQKYLIRFGWLLLIVLGSGIMFSLFQVAVSKDSDFSGGTPLYYYAAAVGCYALMVLYIHFFWGKRYLSLEWIVLFALLFRGLLLWHDPLFDDSGYRHAWDGRIYSAGVHPYSEYPSSERLRGFRDERVYPKVADQDYISPSSPFALELYRIIALFSDHPFVFRVILVVLDLAVIFFLIGILRRMNQATAWVTVYAWNPLVAIESASHGQEMIITVFLFVVALNFALNFRPLYASVFISLAATMHWLWLSVLPFFEDIRSRRKTWMMLLLIAILIFFLLYDGWSNSFIPIARHLAVVYWSEEANSGLFFTVMQLCLYVSNSIEESFFIATRVSYFIGLIGLIVLLYYYWRKSYTEQKQFMIRFVYSIIGLGLLISPALTPSWLLMMMPLLSLAPSGAWIMFSGLVGLYYFRDHSFFSETVGGMDIWRFYEYLPFYIWLMISAFIQWKKRKQSFYHRESL